MATAQRVLMPKSLQFGTDGIWEITPSLAAEWMRRAAKNRTIKPAHVIRLKQLMLADAWMLNGETIKFNEAGELIDGQHRLLACIEAGVTIHSYVLFHLPITAQQTVDVGMKRSPGDMLHFLGEVNTNNLVATLRWVWRYDHQKMEGYTGSSMPSIQDLLTVLADYPSIRAALPYGTLTQRLIQRSLGSALYHLMSRDDEAEAHLFFTRLADGEGLLRTMPLYQLRNRLIANSQSKARLTAVNVAALTVKAWNVTKEGGTVRFLKWQEGQGEIFPRLYKASKTTQ